VSGKMLLTGAGGFIGGYVATEFRERGWYVLGVDLLSADAMGRFSGHAYQQLDVGDNRIGELLAAERPDACVHCAGSASVPMSMQAPLHDFRANVLMTAQLLDALRDHAPACRFVHLSSAAVYGSPAALPIDESTPRSPISAYGFHKLMAEQLCEEYAALHGVPTASARVFSAYGPGLRRQVLWDLCGKLLGEGEVLLQGTGKESRDFIHAADIARALAAIVERAEFKGEAYNVASGSETAISELGARLATTLRSTKRIKFDGVLPAGVPSRWRADIGRLRALGFAPAFAIDQGVSEFASWARAQLTLAGSLSFGERRK
jgi:UDP-glucose 4-epimerase